MSVKRRLKVGEKFADGCAFAPSSSRRVDSFGGSARLRLCLVQRLIFVPGGRGLFGDKSRLPTTR